jgi:hypothetical protein
MKKIGFTTLLSLAVLLFSAPAIHAQAIYAAKENFRLQAGAGFLYLNTDYSPKSAQGLSVWGDVDLFRYRPVLFGAEVEAHFGGIITPDDLGENSYLYGVRASVPRRKLNIYGKLMFGWDTVTNQLLNKSTTYNVVPAFGGGVEYRVTRRINVRAVDVEMEKLPNFEPHTLSPLAISFGASYIIR